MLENNLIYYDEYMFFSFNNIHSSKYNLCIQNNIDDLKIYYNTSAKVNLVQPQYKNGQHVLGVDYPQRTFKLKLVGQHLTRQNIFEICKWLRVGTSGELSFDFSNDWCYSVIITQASDPQLYVQNTDEYIITMDVEFNTISTTHAHTKYNAYYILNDKSTSLNGALSNSGENNNYAGVFNNNLYIPSLTLYKKDNNQYSFNIHHLGDSITYFDITFQYNPVIDTVISSGVTTFDIKLLQESYTTFNTQLQAQINPNVQLLSHTVEYLGLGNLFVTDNQLPEQANYTSHFDQLSVQYNNTPLILQSPGAPVCITSTEQFEQLKTTGYNWFLCKQGQVNADTINPYYHTTNNAAFPYEISNCTIIYDADYTPQDIDFNEEQKWYFGFYDQIILKHNYEYSNPEYTDFQGMIKLYQHTEVI